MAMTDADVSQLPQTASDQNPPSTGRPAFEESGDWFKPAMPRATLVRLSRRSDGKGLARVGGYFALLGGLGAASALLWGGWWFLVPYAGYCLVWSFANAASHEACHYTPFRSRRLNDALLYATTSCLASWASPCTASCAPSSTAGSRRALPTTAEPPAPCT